MNRCLYLLPVLLVAAAAYGSNKFKAKSSKGGASLLMFPPKSVKAALIIPPPPKPKTITLSWGWVPSGPRYYRVWSTTNLLTPFTLRTNAWASPVVFPAQQQEFFIVDDVWMPKGGKP